MRVGVRLLRLGGRVDVGVHARVRLHVCVGGVRVHLRAGVDVDAGTGVGRGRRGGSSSSSRALSGSGALGSKLSIVALRCDGGVVLLLRGQSLGRRVTSWRTRRVSKRSIRPSSNNSQG